MEQSVSVTSSPSVTVTLNSESTNEVSPRSSEDSAESSHSVQAPQATMTDLAMFRSNYVTPIERKVDANGVAIKNVRAAVVAQTERGGASSHTVADLAAKVEKLKDLPSRLKKAKNMITENARLASQATRLVETKVDSLQEQHRLVNDGTSNRIAAEAKVMALNTQTTVNDAVDRTARICSEVL